jgi:hypothetical protein
LCTSRHAAAFADADADADCVDRTRSAKTSLPTPVASTKWSAKNKSADTRRFDEVVGKNKPADTRRFDEVVGKNKPADTRRFDEVVGKNKSAPRQYCLTELGVSGQRRLSVGGAISHFRSRSLREATGTCKAARGYAATVGFRRASCLAPVASTKAVGTDERQHSLGKEPPRSAY